MTSPLRRKRPTTVREPNTLTPTTARRWLVLGLAGLSGLLLAGHAFAQHTPYASLRTTPTTPAPAPASPVMMVPALPVVVQPPASFGPPSAPADYNSLRPVRFQPPPGD